MNRVVYLFSIGVIVTHLGCGGNEKPRPPIPPPDKKEVSQTGKFIDDEDTDGFDAILEASLTSGDTIIVVKTKTSESNWSNRLTAWIKAWSEGGPVKERRVIDGPSEVMAPAPENPRIVEIHIADQAGAAKEARLLIENTLDRFENGVANIVKWYQDEAIRKKRVDLLHPYRFAFARDTKGQKQIIFYTKPR